MNQNKIGFKITGDKITCAFKSASQQRKFRYLVQDHLPLANRIGEPKPLVDIYQHNEVNGFVLISNVGGLWEKSLID